MTGRPRPLTPTESAALAGDLRALADELTRPGSGTVQRSLGVALDHGYPARASGAAGAPSNTVDEDGRYRRPSTQPESGALHPDQIATDAAGLLASIRRTATAARSAAAELAAWHPARPVRFCPRCGHPLQGASTRCDNVIDGTRCEASEGAPARACRICEQTQQPGQPLRSGRCDRCRKWLQRNGVEYPRRRSERVASVDRIQLQANVITGGDPC